MKMQSNNPFLLIKLLTMHSLLAVSVAQDFDFFYFVQQWPGSYCDTKQGSYRKNLHQILEFMDFGLIETMVHIPRTVTLATLSTPPRFQILQVTCKHNGQHYHAQATTD
ncbi:uncharacterized protein LOC143597365 [Bidens hawaiensis]|uniref:uncharacterized protein LOC143597365 n=1 Tax=Bidens hawaiensis TaxID=980011 RepID=UPI00404A0479